MSRVENELTFRQMVDGIFALVAVLTPDGAVEFVNRQVLGANGRGDVTVSRDKDDRRVVGVAKLALEIQAVDIWQFHVH